MAMPIADDFQYVVGKKGLKDDPKELNRPVRNIYKVLMSRGMKGCYVYCVDKQLKNLLNQKSGLVDLNIARSAGGMQ